jgi:hypothetical protein
MVTTRGYRLRPVRVKDMIGVFYLENLLRRIRKLR